MIQSEWNFIVTTFYTICNPNFHEILYIIMWFKVTQNKILVNSVPTSRGVHLQMIHRNVYGFLKLIG
jgi:hypothetical protein